MSRQDNDGHRRTPSSYRSQPPKIPEIAGWKIEDAEGVRPYKVLLVGSGGALEGPIFKSLKNLLNIYRIDFEVLGDLVPGDDIDQGRMNQILGSDIIIFGTDINGLADNRIQGDLKKFKSHPNFFHTEINYNTRKDDPDFESDNYVQMQGSSNDEKAVSLLTQIAKRISKYGDLKTGITKKIIAVLNHPTTGQLPDSVIGSTSTGNTQSGNTTHSGNSYSTTPPKSAPRTPNTLEHEPKFKKIMDMVMHQLNTRNWPTENITFGDNIADTYCIEDIWKDEVKNAFVDYVLNKYGLLVYYTSYPSHDKPTNSFSVQIRGIAKNAPQETKKIFKNRNDDFLYDMVSQLKNKKTGGKVYIDKSGNRSMPSFYEPIFKAQLASLGYAYRLIEGERDKYQFVFERISKIPNTHEDVRLMLLHQELDQQADRAESTESITSPFASAAIQKLENSDASVVFISSRMTNDPGYPFFIKKIQALQKTKNILLFNLDKLDPADLAATIITHPTGYGNMDSTGEVKNWRNIDDEQIYTRRMNEIRKRYFLPLTTVSLITYNEEDKKSKFFEAFELSLARAKNDGCTINS